jgi:hypothetical protein
VLLPSALFVPFSPVLLVVVRALGNVPYAEVWWTEAELWTNAEQSTALVIYEIVGLQWATDFFLPLLWVVKFSLPCCFKAHLLVHAYSDHCLPAWVKNTVYQPVWFVPAWVQYLGCCLSEKVEYVQMWRLVICIPFKRSDRYNLFYFERLMYSWMSSGRPLR